VPFGSDRIPIHPRWPVQPAFRTNWRRPHEPKVQFTPSNRTTYRRSHPQSSTRSVAGLANSHTRALPESSRSVVSDAWRPYTRPEEHLRHVDLDEAHAPARACFVPGPREIVARSSTKWRSTAAEDRSARGLRAVRGHRVPPGRRAAALRRAPAAGRSAGTTALAPNGARLDRERISVACSKAVVPRVQQPRSLPNPLVDVERLRDFANEPQAFERYGDARRSLLENLKIGGKT
jgi:hypothetical protein